MREKAATTSKKGRGINFDEKDILKIYSLIHDAPSFDANDAGIVLRIPSRTTLDVQSPTRIVCLSPQPPQRYRTLSTHGKIYSWAMTASNFDRTQMNS